MLKRFLILLFVVAIPAPLLAQSFITRLPGFYGRVYSDVEGYAYGGQRPLDSNAPNGFTWDGALTLVTDDDIDGFALSVGYGTSTGANPWRFEAGFGRVDADFGGDTNGLSISGIYQLLASEGLYAVNASASAERIDDAYDAVGASLNGELRIPNTDFSLGASLGLTSVDFEFGGSESDVTAAIEAIYSVTDYGFALSAIYQTESDVSDSAGGLSVSWAVPPNFLFQHSNLQGGVLDDLVFVRYRARF
ncbi:MAG: hypothetical protein ABR517_01950 [Thermoanaerobaculia bacterium]